MATLKEEQFDSTRFHSALYQRLYEVIEVANEKGLSKFVFSHDKKHYLVVWNGLKWPDPSEIELLN